MYISMHIYIHIYILKKEDGQRRDAAVAAVVGHTKSVWWEGARSRVWWEAAIARVHGLSASFSPLVSAV